jgi:probable F420-dependent oxidoreductase
MQSNQQTAEQLLADKFSVYVLPGRVADPARGLEEAKEAERIGFGSVWLSERYAVKEPAVLSGALSQVTTTIKITGTMYANIRHPVVTASVCNLMQSLSDNRFRLLLAKGVPGFFSELGLPPITFKYLADFIPLLHRLWAGETINYEGVLGKFPNLVLTDRHDGPAPPIYITAIGPKTLEFAGGYCDGVLLHPFIGLEGMEKSIAIVREAAERAGRDPQSVRIIHTVVTAPNLPKDEEEAVVGGRAVTYFQIPQFGELLVDINGWDRDVLTKLRAHPTFSGLGGGMADQSFTREQLVESSRTLPPHWLSEGAASGSDEQCAKQLCAFLDAGADEIILHGSAPAQMQGLSEELKKQLIKG